MCPRAFLDTHQGTNGHAGMMPAAMRTSPSWSHNARRSAGDSRARGQCAALHSATKPGRNDTADAATRPRTMNSESPSTAGNSAAWLAPEGPNSLKATQAPDQAPPTLEIFSTPTTRPMLPRPAPFDRIGPKLPPNRNQPPPWSKGLVAVAASPSHGTPTPYPATQPRCLPLEKQHAPGRRNHVTRSRGRMDAPLRHAYVAAERLAQASGAESGQRRPLSAFRGAPAVRLARPWVPRDRKRSKSRPAWHRKRATPRGETAERA